MASAGFNIVIWRSKTTNGECGEYGFIVPACLIFIFSRKREAVVRTCKQVLLTTIRTYDWELCQNCSLEKPYSFKQAYDILDQQE